MKKKIEYQVSYEVESTIEYLNEEEPGEHYFSIRREWEGALWDAEEDEAVAYVRDGKIEDIEGYGGLLREAEEVAIREMMVLILEK